MNNIQQMIASKLGLADDEGEIVQQGPKGVKTQGPARYRSFTNGQIRRAERRAQETKRRKATSRYRRNWMRNQLNLAYLRANLQALGLVAHHDGLHPVDRHSDSYRRATETLEARYGSVDEALAKYAEIRSEQVNA